VNGHQGHVVAGFGIERHSCTLRLVAQVQLGNRKRRGRKQVRVSMGPQTVHVRVLEAGQKEYVRAVRCNVREEAVTAREL
jgi:hypothetical protein